MLFIYLFIYLFLRINETREVKQKKTKQNQITCLNSHGGLEITHNNKQLIPLPRHDDLNVSISSSSL